MPNHQNKRKSRVDRHRRSLLSGILNQLSELASKLRNLDLTRADQDKFRQVIAGALIGTMVAVWLYSRMYDNARAGQLLES